MCKVFKRSPLPQSLFTTPFEVSIVTWIVGEMLPNVLCVVKLICLFSNTFIWNTSRLRSHVSCLFTWPWNCNYCCVYSLARLVYNNFTDYMITLICAISHCFKWFQIYPYRTSETRISSKLLTLWKIKSLINTESVTSGDVYPNCNAEFN